MTLVVDGLPRNDTSNSSYVLWGSDPSGRLSAFGTFDVSGDQVVVRRPVPAQLRSTPVLAVSAEPGRRPPDRPSRVVLSSA